MNEDKKHHLIKSGIFGLVVADALGVPYEFTRRHIIDANPMSDMTGYGTYGLPAGTWSDDSSLALATVDGLINSLKSNSDYLEDENSNPMEIIDYEDILQKFSNWLYGNDYTPYGEVFDYGGTTRKGIDNFRNGKDAILSGGNDISDNGNGSLMRILPIAFFIYYMSLKHSFFKDDMMNAVHNLSSLTHRHEISQMACGIYVSIALELIESVIECNGLSLNESVKRGIERAKEYYSAKSQFREAFDNFDGIFLEDIKEIPRDNIRGRGYVVPSLQAALWCLLNNDSYRETTLAAVNLGEDTDTTAAIAGGLAGIYYGYEDIPPHWLDQIAKSDYINELIDDFSNLL